MTWTLTSRKRRPLVSILAALMCLSGVAACSSESVVFATVTSVADMTSAMSDAPPSVRVVERDGVAAEWREMGREEPTLPANSHYLIVRSGPDAVNPTAENIEVNGDGSWRVNLTAAPRSNCLALTVVSSTATLLAVEEEPPETVELNVQLDGDC